jgi:Tfp pilus assembly protein PilE
LLVVVLIIGILSSVAIPQYTTAVERSRASEGITLMGSLAQALERYRSQKDAWPTDNDFSKLDLEMPKNGTNTYGGKLFTITFTSSGSTATIKATRTIATGKSYELQTVITDNATSGLFTRVRHCIDTNVDYCNAITGGHAGASQSF